jgi:ribosome biogenesis GTPase / thiamine phosphate phosphatase
LTKTYGWTPARSQDFVPCSEAGLVPARVVIQKRDIWQVQTLDATAFDASLLGKFRTEALQGEFPVVGDWVALEVAGTSARIHNVLPRTTTLTRKAVGGDNAAQIIAANVDLGLLVCALNEDFNPRRLERYIALCRAGNVQPLIVLTKADLVEDVEPFIAALNDVATGVSILPVSVMSQTGLSALQPFLISGQTAALLGSSGAGKSTLLNALAGSEVMATSAIRYNDGRGRHTTTHRELVTLPSGAMIVDSPGMRELALWDGGQGVSEAFDDVETLAGNCRFSDCQHIKEPGCAIREALQSGVLDDARWAGYQKLQRELAFEQAKTDPILRAENKKMWKRRNSNYVASVRFRDRSID